MPASVARRDLIRKMDLERKLLRDVRATNTKLINNTVTTFAQSGNAFDAASLQADFSAMLNNHYLRTGDIFSVQASKQMPADVAVTTAETLTINQALAVYYTARALDQAAIITATNQNNINAAIVGARETRDELGQPLSQREQAREAGARTARAVRGRESTIATTETQNAAETAKATEAEVLSGSQPAIIAAGAATLNIDKEWVTVGDENVRDSHVLADSQTRDVSKPFLVEGQLLRYPGDTSLGASAANVLRCRCSSVTLPASFIAIRRKPGFAPVTETIPTEQLLESLG